ncbi:hypothetical protein GTY41_07255 [Streptomyces sp. SID685]|uniref:phage tail protein n=1 Tax=Streptomyces TaxID=1883 RepID=UPI00136C51E7|nr:phage tail protein [Streptomyces sp. SID685]MYR84754.1 hypothetical protein [Streptomyces sp. SID685]
MTMPSQNFNAASGGEGPSPGTGRSRRLHQYPRAAMAMRFQVVVDGLEGKGLDLGMWSACRGLQVQFTAKEITQGGDYFTQQLLPDRVKFSTVTLERAMTREESPALQDWLAMVARSWTGYEFDGSESYQPQSVRITLFDFRGEPVLGWALQNAYPKDWSGPELNAKSNAVAVEKISFEHSGFLRLDGSGAPLGA